MNLFVKQTIATFALGLLSLASANATTYNLAGFPFSYMGASSVTATLSTSQTGTFSDAASIEALLNSSVFKAELNQMGSSIALMDNSNADWSVLFSANGSPSATMTISESSILLTLKTSEEFTSAALRLHSKDGRTELQYRQDNNITDQASVNFTKDAMFGGRSIIPFGNTYTFSAIATPVPEPSIFAMLTFGLFALGCANMRARQLH